MTTYWNCTRCDERIVLDGNNIRKHIAENHPDQRHYLKDPDAPKRPFS